MLALQRATHATLHVLADRLAALDLTPAELNALANLVDGPCTVSRLGAAAGSRPTTLTSVLDRLERRGHITRGHPPADRRAVLVGLTPSGAAAAATIHDTIAAVEREALGSLPPSTVAALRLALEALTRGAS